LRIATWNVNSLKARLPAIERWLERAAPDVLLIQETKVSDQDVPELPFVMAGYQIAHHGEGRWNGVAIVSRGEITDLMSNFGKGPVRDSSHRKTEVSEDDFNPFEEARIISGVTEGVRFVSVYAPNGRVVGSPFYEGKLAWFERLRRWLAESFSPEEQLVVAGDFNATPSDRDVWKPAAAHGGTHVSEPERAALADLRVWGLHDAYRLHQPDASGRFSWWDYRAGNFQRNEGMRIDLVFVTAPLAKRVVFAEIDREARKGTPTPSDHAPVVVDLDEPGLPFDAGWEAALERIATRSKR